MAELIMGDTEKFIKGILEDEKAEPTRDYKRELYEAERAIENAEVKLDKAKTLLEHWVQEYGYTEKPDAWSAVAYWSGTDKSKRGEQSATWFWDYNLIFSMVDIVFDYVHESKEILKTALEKKEV